MYNTICNGIRAATLPVRTLLRATSATKHPGISMHKHVIRRSAAQALKQRAPYPIITLEEHYRSSNLLTTIPSHMAAFYKALPESMTSKLSDLSPTGPRMSAMDSSGVTIQVLSNSFGMTSASPAACAEANEELSSALSKAGPRLRAFASLPMKHASAASSELARCVNDFGFVGALIDAHLDDGSYFDGGRFWPVFETAEKLGVPIYIHPSVPTAEMSKLMFEGNYSQTQEMALGIAGWGWHSDTALSVLRMYCAGVFERFPALKIVIGHMGEMIPFMVDRTSNALSRVGGHGLKHSFAEVWNANLWITTSGMFSLAPMATVLRSTKIDRIMFSVDYPYSDNETGLKFLEELEQSGLVSRNELEMIAYKNAENLLNIKADEAQSG